MKRIKTIILFLILISISSTVKSNNLVVGYSIPSEILNLSNSSFVYDTVFIMNNATLNISNGTNFVVNDAIALIGTGKLNVEDSYFEVNNIFSTQDRSTVILKDSLNLSCNLYLTEKSSLIIDSASLFVPMTFKSEYIWWACNNSSFQISNSDIHLNSGALGGSISDSATFTQLNNRYNSTILPMTLGLTGSSVVSIDSCWGGMEFVIQENADVNIQNSDLLMIWFTLADGDTIDYEYPPPNSTLYPLASNIKNPYSFSGFTPNVSGVDFNVNIQNSDGVFWGIMSRENSDVTINNSSLLACGFYFDGTTIDTANGFVNSPLYATYNSPFSDRAFTLNNSSVNAWNFYSTETSEIIIKDCIYGESLGFGDGVTRVYNSTCDGKGGFFGGMGNSKTYVYNSEIIRENGNAQILNFQDNASAWFNQSKIIGETVISGNSQLYFGNTEYSHIPIANHNSYFAEAWLDSINNAYTNSRISITGKVWGINGAFNNSNITRYKIEYSSLDSTDFVSIKDTSATSFNIINDELAIWNTNDLIAGDCLLWLTIFVDGDTVITCIRELTLSFKTSVNKDNVSNDIFIYPNPTNGLVNISGDNILYVEVHNIQGKSIYTGNTSVINLKGFHSGIYFITIETIEKVFIKKLILE